MTAKLKLNAASGGGSFSLQAPSSSANTRVMTLPDTADGTILTTTNPKAGNIIQVKQTVKTDTFSMTGTTYTAITGLTVSITPSSASNKLLITFNLYGGVSAADNTGLFLLTKDGSTISGAIGSASGNNQESATARIRQSSAAHTQMPAFSYLDTAGDTNARTYGIKCKTESGTLRIGITGNNVDTAFHARCPNVITVMEVAA